MQELAEKSPRADTDFLPLNGTDYVEFYVGNARQAAYYYRAAFGMQLVAYSGPETGQRGRASYIVQQNKIRLVLTTPLQPDDAINQHIQRHGDGVHDIALCVDDAEAAYRETTKRGAKCVRPTEVLRDDHGEVRVSAHRGVRRYHPFLHRAAQLQRRVPAGLRPSLGLTRNERIGNEPLDPRLVYECALVEAPRETWARNSWTPPLGPFRYQSQGQTLLNSLQEFFTALFNGAPLESIALEVSAALQCRRESLSLNTAYSIVPIDMVPKTVRDVVTLVFDKCHLLLGGSGDNVTPPPGMDESALRLRIKISMKGDGPKRTLLEIAAIDFPLIAPKTERRRSSRLTKSRPNARAVRPKGSNARRRA